MSKFMDERMFAGIVGNQAVEPLIRPDKLVARRPRRCEAIPVRTGRIANRDCVIRYRTQENLIRLCDLIFVKLARLEQHGTRGHSQDEHGYKECRSGENELAFRYHQAQPPQIGRKFKPGSRAQSLSAPDNQRRRPPYGSDSSYEPENI